MTAPVTNTAKAWVLVGLLWFAFVLNYADRQVIFSLFPVLKAQLGFTNSQLGLTASIFLWIYGSCSGFAGQLSDWFSRRTMILTSLLLWSASTVLSGLAQAPNLLLVSRGLVGLTESLFVPAATALTVGAHDLASRSRAMAVFYTGQLAGLVFGGWYGGFLAERYNWRLAFFSLGLAGIVYMVPLGLFLRRVPESREDVRPAARGHLDFLALLRVPMFRFLCLSFPLYSCVYWLMFAWLPSFLFERFHLTLSEAGFYATAYLQTTSFIGLLGGGFLGDWLFRRTRAARLWLLCGSMLASAPWVYVLGNSGSLVMAKFAAAAFGLGLGVFMSSLNVAACDIVPASSHGAAVGLVNMIGAPCSGLLSLFGGVMKDSVGLSRILEFGAGMGITAALILAYGIRQYFDRDYAVARSRREIMVGNKMD